MPDPDPNPDPVVEADEVIIEGKAGGWAGRIRGRGKQAEGLKKAIDDVGKVGKGLLAILGSEDPLEKLGKLFK